MTKTTTRLTAAIETYLGPDGVLGGSTPLARTSVSGFAEPEFVAAFGPGLSQVADSTLVNQALSQLLRHVAEALWLRIRAFPSPCPILDISQFKA